MVQIGQNVRRGSIEGPDLSCVRGRARAGPVLAHLHGLRALRPLRRPHAVRLEGHQRMAGRRRLRARARRLARRLRAGKAGADVGARHRRRSGPCAAARPVVDGDAPPRRPDRRGASQYAHRRDRAGDLGRPAVRAARLHRLDRAAVEGADRVSRLDGHLAALGLCRPGEPRRRAADGAGGARDGPAVATRGQPVDRRGHRLPRRWRR